MRPQRLGKTIAALLIGTASAPAIGLESFGMTPQETALCSALVFEGADRETRMRAEPGIGWEDAHHWCDCVRFRYRAIRSIGDLTAFNYNTGQSLQGCDYVIHGVRPGSRILPKVHVDKGRILKLRSDPGGAIREFQRALSLNPREIDAYIELSLLQEESGEKAAARETVAAGLRYAPDVQKLQRRYIELGGKKPFPEPVERATQEQEGKPAESSAADSSGVEPAASVVKAEAMSDDTQRAGGEASDTAADGTGPSCRFCPPEEIQRRWAESFRSSQEKKEE